jgi:hypothetical protein
MKRKGDLQNHLRIALVVYGEGGIRTILETPASIALSNASGAESGAFVPQTAPVALSNASGAESGAFVPQTAPVSGLAFLLDAWPKLPEAIRAGILAMVQAAGA